MIDLPAGRVGLVMADGVHTSDILTGTEGADSLFGGDGDDVITGLGGNDSIRGYGGSDSIDAGDGVDRIWLYAGGDTVHAGAGDDSIFLDVTLPGAGAGGVYYGDEGRDVVTLNGVDAKAADGVTLYGGAGDDSLQEWSAGDDLLDGGDGYDSVICNRRPHGITVDLVAGSCSGKDIGVDQLVGIENFYSGRGDDSITGNDGYNGLFGKGGADVIVGGGGGDILYGGGAFDTLTGGAGKDTLNGGGGHDTLVFLNLADSTTDNADVILVLKKHDVIDLSAIDADAATAGDQAFVKVKAFGGHAGELTMSFTGSLTLLQLDVDGDAQADMAIQILGNHLTYDAFML